MSSLNKSSFSKILFSYFPTLILFLSVFNEYDFNHLKIEYFSFNFVYILIFYWTLRSPNQLGYISIFLAGIINDVVIGLPIGVSSLSYLLICSVTAYIRNITLIYNFMNDWMSILFTLFLINSIQILILDFVFNYNLDYLSYLVNTGFTFLLYPLFYLFFNYLDQKILLQPND